jgi:hypothetical protein
VPATLANEEVIVDLRTRLLRAMSNIELRQKYLATRTPAWAGADLERAAGCLLAVRLLRGVVGLALVGAAGGAIGSLLLSSPANGKAGSALPVVVGIGSALSGALSFALLGALGFVVLAEVVGEEKPRRYGGGVSAILVQMTEIWAETACGAIWGAICGLFIGLIVWLLDVTLGLPHVGALDNILAGVLGGLLLATIFGACILTAPRTKKASWMAQHWADLGPLPITTYFASCRAARFHYLHKR